MQSSVRAVEAYRRSRLIDGVTSDEDKVAPVYRLEEICQVLRSSPLDIVREMLEHTMKRLEHKNPIVKQKTLRFIKYAAGKGGTDFKREMQRQAGVIKSYFHYKGQLDALKGDALNKAVRETAHEAVAAIFGTEETTTKMEDVGKRIQGFGSSNYDPRPREEEKKSVLTELVGFGSQTIKQSLEMIQNYNHYTGSGSGNNRTSSSSSSSFSGTYRSQGLRRSLTAERDKPFQRDDREQWNVRDAEADDGVPTSSSKDNSSYKSEVSNGRGNYPHGNTDSTVESRLLDSLTTPGGIRLHPTRETLQAFTTTSQNLDAANLVNSLELKLKAHNWQVRFKALCLIESSIRQREENKVLDSVTVMFEEDASAIVDSLQSPQATLRDKAKKVMDMLGGGIRDVEGEQGLESGSKAAAPPVADLPDLLDTSDFDLTDTLETTPAPKQEPPVPSVAAQPAEIDLFGDWVDEPAAKVPAKDAEADPFAGMAFHSAENSGGSSKEPDLFSGLDMDGGRRAENGGAVEGSGRKDDGSSLFDGLSATQGGNTAASQDSLVDLMGSLSTSNGTQSAKKAKEQLQGFSSLDRPVQQQVPMAPSSNFSGPTNLPNLFQMAQPQRTGVQVGGFQGSGVAPQMYFIPAGNGQYVQGFPGAVPGQFPANVMVQPGFSAGPVNYAGMNAAFTQQQYTPGFSGMPRYGGMPTGNTNGGGLPSTYPDNFDFSGDPESRYASVAESMKKEDNRAFDFISEHVSSQLGPKKSR
ncbi:unnamed protein product [Calypogeia fissa]